MQMRKTVHFQTFLQKVKSYFLLLSIILGLIPIEILEKYISEAP
jgi:hypothetical protein